MFAHELAKLEEVEASKRRRAEEEQIAAQQLEDYKRRRREAIETNEILGYNWSYVLEVGTRACKALSFFFTEEEIRNRNEATLFDLIERVTIEKLLGTPNCGLITAREIADVLHKQFNLSLREK